MPPSTITAETELAKVAVLPISLGDLEPLPVVDIELMRCMYGAGRTMGSSPAALLFERVLQRSTRMTINNTSAASPATTPPISAAWVDFWCSTSSTDSLSGSESLRKRSAAWYKSASADMLGSRGSRGVFKKIRESLLVVRSLKFKANNTSFP